MSISVANCGQELVSTNYWETEHARKGFFYLSCNAGAWRLLVPDVKRTELSEMATASFVDVDLVTERGRKCVVLCFDDGTKTPYCLMIDGAQMDRKMVPETTQRPLLIYTRSGLVQSATIRSVKRG